MAPGRLTAEQLIGDVERGIYVTQLIGQGVNPVTGDYSRGAAGFIIEQGRLGPPVAEITIAGNLLDMFANLIPADDLELRRAVNVPTLRIDGMTIAGA
jgi:PmbA protein